MSTDTVLFNLDDPKQKARLIKWIYSLKGLHRIKVSKVRRQRTLSQNAYYWGVVIPHVCAGLAEAWGEEMESETCHEWLKAKFLALEPVVNRTTGELMGRRIASSAKLNTKEFSDYVDKIIQFASEYLGVETPPAESFREIMAT